MFASHPSLATPASKDLSQGTPICVMDGAPRVSGQLIGEREKYGGSFAALRMTKFSGDHEICKSGGLVGSGICLRVCGLLEIGLAVPGEGVGSAGKGSLAGVDRYRHLYYDSSVFSGVNTGTWSPP
jgi:hypothetical protein